MPNKFISVNRTYSLTMTHINKVVEMALFSRQSQGEIVREAIDLLYTKKMPVNGVVACDQQSVKKTMLKKFQTR